MTVGDPCPAGDWPEGLPAEGEKVYVKPGGTGDGWSPSSPVGTLAAALRLAAGGAVIAVAKGDYAETITTTREVTLWGACAALVRIGGPAGDRGSATVGVPQGGGFALKNLTVRGARGGVVVASRAKLRATGVEVSSATGGGIVVIGEAELRDVFVHDTKAFADGTSGSGIQVTNGGKVTALGVTVEANRDSGIVVAGTRSSAIISDALVRNTESQPSDRARGSGLQISNGGQATITGAVFDGNRSAGILVSGRGSDAKLSDIAVTRTREREAGRIAGVGLYASEGGKVTATRLVVDGNRSAGVLADGAETAATLEDLVVRNTEGQLSDKQLGTGLAASDGAKLVIARAIFDANRSAGIFVDGSATAVSLADVLVHGTRSQELDGNFGVGIQVTGAKVTADRAAFDANLAVGVHARGPGTKLTFADVVVSNTESEDSSKLYGAGLVLGGGADAKVSNSEFTRNRVTAISVDGAGTVASLSDVVMKATRSEKNTKRYGIGLAAVQGAHVEVARATIDHNSNEGVQVVHEGTELAIEDSLISNTEPSDANGEYGIGMVVALGAKAKLKSSRITANRVAGVLAMHGASVEMSSSEVTGVAGGKITLWGPTGAADGAAYEGVGDGVVVAQASNAKLIDVHTKLCAGAGVLFSGSTGSLERVTSTNNRFGLAVQEGGGPSYDAATCSLGGNGEKEVLIDGNLPVANAPPQVPQLPAKL